MRAATDTGRRQIGGIEAGQHRDRDDLGMDRRRRLGVLQHRPPAAGMNREDRGLDGAERLHRLGDRVRNIVQLQVQKDRQAKLCHVAHALLAVGAEEFEAQLQAADVRARPRGDRFGAGDVGRVDRDIDRAHIECPSGAGVSTGSATTGTMG